MLFDDVTMKENIYGIAGALENESEEGVCNENEILAGVFEALDKLENGESIKQNLTDVLELTSLNYFAKGMKMGARINRLLMNSVCNNMETYKG